MERRRAVGIALIVVSACAFGSGPLFAKPVYAAGVDWHVLSAWRFGLGALLAWSWLLASDARRAGLRRLGRRATLVSIGLGVFYTGNSATYYAGLETVSASLAALIVYIYPALVAVVTWRFGQRLEGRRAWAALGLALLGVGLAVGGIPAGTAPPALGLALMIASPVIYTGWIVLSARFAGERPAEDRVEGPATPVLEASAPAPGADPHAPGTDAAVVTAVMIGATATTYWVSALALGREVLPAAIPAAAWPGLVGVGVVATFVAIQTFYAGTRRIGAAQAALVSTVEPIWTIALASVLFGERLGSVQLLGGALIIGGVVLAQTGPSALGRPRAAVRLPDE